MATETISFTEMVEQMASTIQAPEGAKPQSDIFISHKSPKLVPHVDPYEAAKQIRALARQLVDQAPNVGLSSTDASKRLGNAYRQVGYTRSRREEEAYWIAELKLLAKTRRTASILAGIKQLEDARKNTAVHVEESYKIIGTIVPASIVTDNTSTKATAKQIHKLAQSIPTIPTAPVLPVDQVLRAICTILKNAGYIDAQGKAVQP